MSHGLLGCYYKHRKQLPHRASADFAGSISLGRSVVFLCSTFPSLSETFLYDQFRSLQAEGLRFKIVSNHRPCDEQVHPQMREILSEVTYLCETKKTEMLVAHLSAFVKHPLRYLKMLLRVPLDQEKLSVTLSHITGAAIVLRCFAQYPQLHFHAHFTYGAASVAMWAGRMSGISYSLTLHGSDLIFDNPPGLEEKLGSADALVCISQFNAEFVRANFPGVNSRKLVVIPMGIPPLESVPLRPSRSEFLQLLTVGRLSNQKAQHLLIDACALLSSRGIKFSCCIVGEGEQRAFLEERILERHLESCVKLLGPRFHHEVLSLYAETDIFVLCSIAEGQPIVLMEAMRAGVPLVSSAIAAIPELVQDAGMLVPPNDPQALADAIQCFAQGDINVAQMTKRGRCIISKQYDLATNSRRFKEFLEAV